MSGRRIPFAGSLPSSLVLPLLTLTATAGISVWGGEAKAIIYPVFSRSALGTTEFINWGTTLGAAGEQPLNPSDVTTDLGTQVKVSMSATGDFLRLDETSTSNPWQGNFTTGDKLLATDTAANILNPISLVTTTKGFAGVGANIQASRQEAFTARLSVFDQSDALLGQFDFNGLSDTTPGTAIFIGARSSSSSESIYKTQFSILSPTSGMSQFAINQVDYTNLYVDPSTGVPAPLPILGSGAAFAFSRRLKARIRAAKQP